MVGVGSRGGVCKNRAARNTRTARRRKWVIHIFLLRRRGLGLSPEALFYSDWLYLHGLVKLDHREIDLGLEEVVGVVGVEVEHGDREDLKDVGIVESGIFGS